MAVSPWVQQQIAGSPQMPGRGSSGQWGSDSYMAWLQGQQGAGPSHGVGQAPGGFTSGMNVQLGAGANDGWGKALQDAYNQSQQSYDQGLKALGSNFSTGPFGQGLQNMFSNPQGMSPEAYNGYLRMIRDREAGSRGNALEALQNGASASGFGDSMGLLDAGANLRARSASNLNNAELELLMQRENMKNQQQSMSGSLLAQLFGIDAGRQQSLAQGYMNRPFQAFAPTQQQGGSAGQGFGPPPGQVWGW